MKKREQNAVPAAAEIPAVPPAGGEEPLIELRDVYKIYGEGLESSRED